MVVFPGENRALSVSYGLLLLIFNTVFEETILFFLDKRVIYNLT